MTYTPQTWLNGPGGGTPLNATRLTYIETGIKALSDLIASMGGSGLGWINVRDRGAVGDGTTAGTGTDDRAAIIAARDAAGVYGTVWFPKSTGDYLISAPVKPLEGQVWWFEGMGRYAWDSSVNGRGGLRASSSFSGAAVIYNDPSTSNGLATGVSRGVKLVDARVFGRGEAGSVNGVDFGPASGSERRWMLYGGSILHCKTGLAGHMWVVTCSDVHVARCEVGLAAHRGMDGNSRINDSLFDGCYFYFTKSHAAWLGGPVESGHVSFTACRFERAGVSMDPMDPNVNRDEAAHGLYITRATCVRIIGCSSDANSGNGLRLEAVSNDLVNNVSGAGNTWKRDGTGNNTDSMVAGVSISGTTQCRFDGDTVTWGDPNDAGTGRVAPQYGLEYSNNRFLVWKGTIQLQTGTVTNGIREFGTANYRCQVENARSSYTMMPQFRSDDSALPAPIKAGYAFDDSAGVKAPVYSDGVGWFPFGGQPVWKGSQAAYDGLPARADNTVYGVVAGGGVRRLFIGDDLMSQYTIPFVGFRNSFVGISSGTAVTTGNSGGASGDAFTTVSGSLTADTAADLTDAYDRGAVAALAASQGSYGAWGHGDYAAGCWGRVYARRSAVPGVTTRIARGYTVAGNVMLWEIRWQADGTVVLANSAGDWIVSMGGADAINTIYRIEWQIGAIGGLLRVFLGESITPLAEMVDQPGVPTAGVHDQTRFGIFTTSAQTLSHQLAAPAIATSRWIGPA